MSKVVKFLRQWGPAVLWAGLIFWQSSRALPRVGRNYTEDWLIKNLAHVAEYFVLYLGFFRGVNWQKQAKNYLLPLVLIVVYGISDEFHQSFVPGRSAWWGDVGFDLFGGLLAWWFKRTKSYI